MVDNPGKMKRSSNTLLDPVPRVEKRKRNAISKYPKDSDPLFLIKEQLRLFAFNGSPLPSPDFIARVRQELSRRERLATLLEGELNFHGEDSGYASHDLHAFAAKFPPQLPRAFIRGLTEPDDAVLDPMMGSGTTVVEAFLEGRRGIGLDIDPLALRLAHVKTMPADTDRLRQAGYKVISRANALLSRKDKLDRGLCQRLDAPTRAFIDYWFLPTTQRELMALVLAIQDVTDGAMRRFLELTFSSIIVTKSGGVSRARDLAHSRPHLDTTKIPKDAVDQFSLRLRKNLASIAQIKMNGTSAAPVAGDARLMPFADGVIDLIVTSPPYANAIDYMRAHKFSLVWLGENLRELSELRAGYIGSERVGHAPDAMLPDRAESTTRKLAERDGSKAAILRKYFVEMKSVLAEMYRVLSENSAAIVVVGPSVMRGIDIQTHYCLADIAAGVGFDVVGIARRALDRNKRMMPARFGKKSDSIIEQRMHEEFVIGLLKPAHLRGKQRAKS
ncbi:MAG: site-specific DNA-methyltransferase [Deltaproteobacteria bacterium]|nr:site-specific DNA-methyltransferase [Deltaproteobacteria bacterium]